MPSAGKLWFLSGEFQRAASAHGYHEVTWTSLPGIANFRSPTDARNFTPEVHVAIRQNYAAMIENIDRWLGKFTDALKRRGEFDNTLIVLSSDHGEMLGDHDLWGKTKPHQPSVGVPLIAAGPGSREGQEERRAGEQHRYRRYVPGLRGRGKGEARWTAAPFARCWKVSRRRIGSMCSRASGSGVWYRTAGSSMSADTRSSRCCSTCRDPLENRNIAGKAPGGAARLAKLLG